MKNISYGKQKYYQLFPKRLHRQVDRLINYLTYFPFETPECCVYCGSDSFHARHYRNAKIENFVCNHCKGRFNRLTGTLLARSWHLEAWRPFAQLRLSGYADVEIMITLGLSQKAVKRRDRVFKQLLLKDYPDIYQWWKPYQDRIKKEIDHRLVEKETQIIFGWLRELTTRQEIPCKTAYCKSQGFMMKRRTEHRLHFYCKCCENVVDLLDGTPLHKRQNIQIWEQFLKLMIQGESNSDLSREFNMCWKTVEKFRHGFLAVMRQKRLDELHEWIIWQRKRRMAQAYGKRDSSGTAVLTKTV